MSWKINNKFTYPKSMRSIYNGSRHYDVSGDKYPSVTNILAETKSQEDKDALNKWKKENHPSLVIEVDGNVSWENIPPMVNAGSNVLVLGTSSVFTKEYPRQEAYQKLKSFLN